MAVEVWPTGEFHDLSILVSTSTGTVIAPVICTPEHAERAEYPDTYDMMEAFLVWLPFDPRKYDTTELAEKFDEFITHRRTRNDPQF